MIIENITADNPLIEKYKKLRKLNSNFLILESEKVILYALKMGLVLEEILSYPDFFQSNKNIHSKRYYSIDKKYLNEIIGYKSHSGVFATILIPPEIETLSKRVIILDSLTSPENVGSICRSASAFGFKTVIYNSNGISPYLRRCIRVSTGHVLGLNIIKSNSLPLTIEKLKEDNFKIICAHNSINSNYLENIKNDYEKLAIVIGSEGHGITNEVIQISDLEIKISTHIDVDHLNASNAASIMMHHFKSI